MAEAEPPGHAFPGWKTQRRVGDFVNTESNKELKDNMIVSAPVALLFSVLAVVLNLALACLHFASGNNILAVMSSLAALCFFAGSLGSLKRSKKNRNESDIRT